MIIKIKDKTIRVEGFQKPGNITTGSLSLLDIDIFIYVKHINPNTDDFAIYEHKKIPLLWNDRLYILYNFKCSGMNNRERKGLALFEDVLEIDKIRIKEFFNDEDLNFLDSLKGIKKFNL